MSSKHYVIPLSLFMAVTLLLPGGGLASRGADAGSEGSDGSVLFIENAGQFDPATRFQVWGGGQTLWLAEDAIWITVVEQESGDSGQETGVRERGTERSSDAPDDRGAVFVSGVQKAVNIRLSFHGANPQTVLEPFDRLDTHVSYFIGADPEKWRADVPTWGGVRYRDLYPGLDLEITGEGGQWSWRLICDAQNCGARCQQSAVSDQHVTLRVEGADAAAVDDTGLRLSTAAGDLALPLLTAERANVERANVERLDAQALEVVAPFAVTNAVSQSAVRNPQSTDLIYGTFLGRGSQWGGHIAVDRAGSAYVAGWIYTRNSSGVYFRDVFVVKLNPAGSGLVYATFLGGSGDDYGGPIAVDAAGNAYLAGSTRSSDFPVTPGAFDTSLSGTDAFVVKLNPAGSELAYATFLGGSSWNDYGFAMAVDRAGSAYVTGLTGSPDFPTTPGAFDTSYNGGGGYYGGEAFVAKLDPSGSGLAYGTFLGGSETDWGNAIAVDARGNAYLTGETYSSDFPVTPGAFDTSGKARWVSADAFAVKLDPTGSTLAYATYLGGSDGDWGEAITADAAGNAYLTGDTGSDDFPTTPGAFDTSFNGYSDAFAVKLNPAGSRLVYGTFLGGSDNDDGRAIAADAAGRAYVTGVTYSRDFPATSDAFDPSYNGGHDAYVVMLNTARDAPAYATFLGGRSVDEGTGIAVDAAGRAYVTGVTYSSDFPVTPGAFDTSLSGADAFVVKLLIVHPPAIRGAIWHDLDGDATRDAGEPGLAGVQVCAEPLGHRAVRCTISGEDGTYEIEVDPPATYLVTPAGAPAGMQLTTPGFRLPVTVGEGQQVGNVDFGYW
jgi:hypothetical protein